MSTREVSSTTVWSEGIETDGLRESMADLCWDLTISLILDLCGVRGGKDVRCEEDSSSALEVSLMSGCSEGTGTDGLFESMESLSLKVTFFLLVDGSGVCVGRKVPSGETCACARFAPLRSGLSEY